MMQKLLNNPNLINWVIIIFAVAIAIFVLYPITKNFICDGDDGPQAISEEDFSEKFNSEEAFAEEADIVAETVSEAVAENGNGNGNGNGNANGNGTGPYVDSKTGSLIDGPGFEKGEIDDVHQESATGIPSNYYFLDDGAGGEMSIQHNLCSKSCCSEQWPKI